LDPGSPRARLRAPGRVAYDVIQDTDVQQQEEEEEAGVVPELMKRGCGGNACTSQFAGVSWAETKDKWVARYHGKYLGYHTTEEGAACAYSKYLKDGIEPAKRRDAITSQLKGISWDKAKLRWRVECNRKHLGYHATEEDAALAYSKFLKDGIDPVKHREASTSQFTGVFWAKAQKKWNAKCKGKHLGYHTTEQAAARANSNYLEDGVLPGHAGSSQFMGVSWNTSKSK
jgi:hypothetical protein